VIGYGTDALPAFYVRDSGLPVDVRADDADAVAGILRTHWDLGLGGALIANPIPEADALDAVEIETAISAAVDEAERDGVGGKVLTPFLLGRLAETTGGASLAANKALLLNNARVAAEIAGALAAR